ncbi:ATP-binding cassette domain-containing protein [Paenibacillus albicereus]|uniref:ATP-binding cassette domain-containing protein n=1 Tax=Paenibacillus albicereus TaxID=2726185 RepID=A0A6H2GXT1_9BACL|nr:ATP-binding cassette domain-containing protein [Paenibacillus albicereus]QJC52207.1 ATP-binding cassette domain-containing protein [Paenibacillus albicereus]
MQRAQAAEERLVRWDGHIVQRVVQERLRTILGPASLELRQGEWLALCGSNGSGKSTLLRELAGFGASPDGIRHQRFAAAPFAERPFAVVLQQPDAALVGSTAREDLILTLEYAGMEGSRILSTVQKTLKRFGLEALADTPAERLSGGQKQLVAIAGAVAAGSPALLFDEATSMLDAESARLVLQQVRQLHRAGAAVVWCTQRLDELEREDRVLALADGKIDFDGRADAFFVREGGEASACERVGLAAPYAVRAAWALQDRGRRLSRLPLRLEELAPALEPSSGERHAAEASGAVSDGADGGGPDGAEQKESARGERSVAIDRRRRGMEDADLADAAESGLAVEQFRPDAADVGKGAATELRVPPGRILLLVGSNGSGKSTLLESLAGLRMPSTGTIRYGPDRLWLGKRPNRAVLLRLGATLQQSETQWFARTVREELEYSARPFRLTATERDGAIAEALRQAVLPQRLLEQDPLTLSGGQQRRLALACALVGGPEWLLLDEPAAGLDAEGIERLAELLRRHRAHGGSAVVSAHSLAALLPIADGVAVMEAGALKETLPAKSYARQLAARGDGAAPPQLLAAARFGAAEEGRLWLEPEELAERLAGADLAAESDCAAETPADADSPDSPAEPQPDAAGAQARLPGSGLPDPRALVASYLLVGAGVMAQSNWTGLTLALAGAVLLAASQRERIRLYLPLARGYAVFALTLAAIAGIQLSPIGFDAPSAALTLFKLTRLFAVLLLGLPLLSLLPPFRLQRAADQLLRPLARFGAPVSRVTLSISLLFRFLPLLAGEWGRYARIAAARGKLAARPGKVPAAMLSRIVLPFLLSLIRLGDSVADALEARGFGHGAAGKTAAFRLRFTRADLLLLACASAACLLLLALR